MAEKKKSAGQQADSLEGAEGALKVKKIVKKPLKLNAGEDILQQNNASDAKVKDPQPRDPAIAPVVAKMESAGAQDQSEQTTHEPKSSQSSRKKAEKIGYTSKVKGSEGGLGVLGETRVVDDDASIATLQREIKKTEDEDIDSDVEQDEQGQGAVSSSPIIARRRSSVVRHFKGIGGFLSRIFGRKKLEVAVEPEVRELTREEKLEILSTNQILLTEELAKIADFTARAEQKQELLQTLDSTLLDVETYVQKVERSYFWKAEKRMQESLATANSDIAEYESLVRSLELPERGKMLSLRKKFHKGLTITFLISLIPVFLLFFIPWVARADFFGWLVDAFRSPWFLPLVAVSTAVVIGFRLLLIRLLGAKTRSSVNRGWFKLPALIALAPLAVFGLYRIQEWLLIFVVPIIERIRLVSLLVVGILFFFGVLTLLIGYYQGWSVFRRQVTEEFSRLDNVVQGYVKTKQELSRLEFLYKQTQEWMQILAHTLHRPWKIHPDWKSSNQLHTSSESFPLALRVAQAVETDVAQTAQLQRLVAKRLLTQGWRAEAFERAISNIGKSLGYEESKISPELLDADLPHQPNNSRRLVLKYFEHSSQTAIDGYLDLEDSFRPAEEDQKPRPNDHYLVDVARAQLSSLIESTQGVDLAEAKPSVQQIVRNPVSDLVMSELENRSDIEVSNWDDFLSDALGVEETLQPPLGVLSFSEEGLKAKSPEAPSSKILVPERFVSSIPESNSSSLSVVSIKGDQVLRAAEVIVRMDVSDPIPFSHVALIQNSQSVRRAEVLDTSESNDDL